MNHNLTHAYLVAGESGQDEHAKSIAKQALCQENITFCNQCSHCVKVEKGIHPDFTTHVNPDGKPLDIEQVRAIRSDAFIRPNEGERKVYFIKNADNLSEKVQNTLLKILEEPPKFVVFILSTGESVGVIPTVRSRCQVVHLAPPTQTIEQHALATALANQIATEQNELALLEGCMPIAKMKKEEILWLTTSIRTILVDLCKKNPTNKRLMKGIALMSEIEHGAEFHVTPSGFAALICGTIFENNGM